MRAGLIATLGLCLCVVACHKPDPYAMKPGPVQEWAHRQPNPKEADDSKGQEVALLTNSFAFKFFGALDKPGENFCFSPFSMVMTLTIIANGAQGDTQKLICDTLGDKGGVKPLNGGVWDLMTLLHSGSDCPITLSNAVWTTGSVQPSAAFKKNIEEHLDATTSVGLPRGKAGADVINRWSAAQTDGMIGKVLNNVDPDCNVVVASAAVFKGRWQTEFDPTKSVSGDFTDSHGARTEATYMLQGGQTLLFGEKDGAKWLELPYKAKDFAMVLILPEHGSPEDYLEKLSWESWGTSLGELRPDEPLVKIPRFTLRSQHDLNSALPKLGLGELLKHADLSGIAPELKNQFISQAVQAAYVEVSEEGTRAAATTASEDDAGPSANFIADHPFAFAIVHRPTGAILFLGVCNDPSKS